MATFSLSYSGADIHMRAHIELSEMENMAVPGGVWGKNKIKTKQQQQELLPQKYKTCE